MFTQHWCSACRLIFPDYQTYEIHLCPAKLKQDLAAMKKFDADPINHPTHYTQGAIQPIDFIVANDMGFLAGNVVKYLTRYKHKNGVEDLKKALAYLERLIKLEEEKSK